MCLLATDQLFFCLMCSEIAIKQLIFELFGMDPVTAVRVRGLSPSHFLFAHLVRQAEGHRILESRSRQAPCSEKHVLLCKCSKTQGFPRNINILLHKSIDVCSKGRLPTVSRASPDCLPIASRWSVFIVCQRSWCQIVSLATCCNNVN